MSYWIRPRAGFGDFIPAQVPNYEDCNPRDVACVARNQARNVGYVDDVLAAQANANRDLCIENASAQPEPWRSQQLAECASRWPAGLQSTIPVQNLPPAYLASGEAFQTPAQAAAYFGSTPQAPAAAPRGGSVTFSSSRGGSILYPGDTWTVKITGASPNLPVTVSGSMPSGSFTNTPMGSTDGSGSFTKSGTIAADQVGAWSESWAVGGAASGSYTFTVRLAAGSPAGSPAAAPSAGLPAGSPAGAPAVGGFSFDSIPWWGWALAAGVGVVVLGGRGGR